MFPYDTKTEPIERETYYQQPSIHMRLGISEHIAKTETKLKIGNVS